MSVRELIDLLGQVQDQDSSVVLGNIVELGGGLAAHVDTDTLYLTKISNFVVLHTSHPKKTNDHGNKLGTLTDFE
ncbi:MAG: hypothetical protein EBZ49_11545 [Proteobacteria bacterium]|nr:hypothetical protein [Pseudomonadota bacterium]